MTAAVKDLTRVLAPNPSALTGPGTNTFVLGRRERVVIDPGPDDATHLDAIMAAAGGQVSHILVTHAHRDHSAGAARLAQMTGAPVLAFGGATAGRSPLMQRLAAQGLVGGGEGLDHGFRPDILLRDGDRVATAAGEILALHTPGHAGGHLCFAWAGALFSGDIVMGWTSTLISPPDGDLTDYLRSLARIRDFGACRLYPAHGDPVETPAARINALLSHRRRRSAQITQALRSQPDNAAGLARRIYDVPARLRPAAERNVLAHLVAMFDIGVLETTEEFSADAHFRPC